MKIRHTPKFQAPRTNHPQPTPRQSYISDVACTSRHHTDAYSIGTRFGPATILHARLHGTLAAVQRLLADLDAALGASTVDNKPTAPNTPSNDITRLRATLRGYDLFFSRSDLQGIDEALTDPHAAVISKLHVVGVVMQSLRDRLTAPTAAAFVQRYTALVEKITQQQALATLCMHLAASHTPQSLQELRWHYGRVFARLAPLSSADHAPGITQLLAHYLALRTQAADRALAAVLLERLRPHDIPTALARAATTDSLAQWNDAVEQIIADNQAAPIVHQQHRPAPVISSLLHTTNAIAQKITGSTGLYAAVVTGTDFLEQTAAHVDKLRTFDARAWHQPKPITILDALTLLERRFDRGNHHVRNALTRLLAHENIAWNVLSLTALELQQSTSERRKSNNQWEKIIQRADALMQQHPTLLGAGLIPLLAEAHLTQQRGSHIELAFAIAEARAGNTVEGFNPSHIVVQDGGYSCDFLVTTPIKTAHLVEVKCLRIPDEFTASIDTDTPSFAENILQHGVDQLHAAYHRFGGDIGARLAVFLPASAAPASRDLPVSITHPILAAAVNSAKTRLTSLIPTADITIGYYTKNRFLDDYAVELHGPI